MSFTPEEQKIIQWSTENGKSVQEMKDAIFRYRTTGSPADPEQVQPETVEEPGVLERVGSVFSEAGQQYGKAIRGEDEFEGQTPVRRGVEATAEIATAVPEAAVQVLPEPAREAIGKVGETVGKGFQALTGKIAETDLFKEIGELEAQGFITKENAPQLFATREALGTVSATGEIAGDVLLAEGAAQAAVKTGKVATQAVAKGSELLKGVAATGAKGVKEATAKAVNPTNIMQRVARVSKGKQIKFEALAKESVGNYLVKRGIFGDTESVVNQLYKRFTESKGKVDTAFGKIPGKFKNTSVGNALKQLLEKEQRVSSPGSPSRNLEVVRELSRKYKGDGLTMTEINQVKRLYEKNVKLDFVKEVNTDKVAGANAIDDAIREWQRTKAAEFGFKELQELNRETMLAKQLLDDLGAEYAGKIGNNAVTLTDWIILAGGEPSNVAGFLTKKALASQKIQSAFAKRLAGDKKLGLPDVTVTSEPIKDFGDWIRSIEGRTKQQ